MAQAMIDLKNKNKKHIMINKETQTGDNTELYVSLSNTKYFRLYFNEKYNDTFLAFNINCSKQFIITKSMWKIFRNYINFIDSNLNG